MDFTKAVLVGLLVGAVAAGTLGTGPAAAADEAGTLARNGRCELRIDGESIDWLRIEGTGQSVKSSAGVLHLLPGWYHVSQVVLEGGYEYQYMAPAKAEPMEKRIKDAEGSFELTPGHSYTLKVGGPLRPTVKVSRQGKYLKLDYDLVDAEGRSYKRSDPRYRSAPPRFVVYRGDREVGSGTFRYG